MNSPDLIEIDGSLGEGGGSILRLCTGFSVLFNKPVKIFNIRANRSVPGLRLQHLLGLQTLAKLTNSTLSHCEVGTTDITFVPNQSVSKHILRVKVNTAASIGLLLQPIQIAALSFRNNDPITITLNGGGTIGKWAPGLNYLNNVVYHLFQTFGYEILVDIKKYGFYPKGQAHSICRIIPPKQPLKKIELTELGNITTINGKIVCSHTLKKSRVAERIKSSIEKSIKSHSNFQMKIESEYIESTSIGVGACLWSHSSKGATISSGTILGEKNVSSENVGRMAASTILKYIKHEIPVDNFLSDQIIPLMVYNESPSKMKVLEVTNHTKTNLDLINKFTDIEYNIISNKDHAIIEVFPNP